jgi:hypothetical protein
MRRQMLTQSISRGLGETQKRWPQIGQLWGKTFPSDANYDFRPEKFSQAAARATELGSEIAQRYQWRRLWIFQRQLSTSEFQSFVLRNERSKAADFIERHLPREFLTQRELKFWTDQIEAIRNRYRLNLCGFLV